MRTYDYEKLEIPNGYSGPIRFKDGSKAYILRRKRVEKVKEIKKKVLEENKINALE